MTEEQLRATEDRLDAVVAVTSARLGLRVGPDELAVALKSAADVPALLAEVRRLGKAVVAQRTALEEARDHLYRWQAATAPDDEIEHGSNAITTVCAALGVEP